MIRKERKDVSKKAKGSVWRNELNEGSDDCLNVLLFEPAFVSVEYFRGTKSECLSLCISDSMTPVMYVKNGVIMNHFTIRH